eukprot:3217886-Prymnesium_polylepis.1
MACAGGAVPKSTEVEMQRALHANSGVPNLRKGPVPHFRGTPLRSDEIETFEWKADVRIDMVSR